MGHQPYKFAAVVITLIIAVTAFYGTHWQRITLPRHLQFRTIIGSRMMAHNVNTPSSRILYAKNGPDITDYPASAVDERFSTRTETKDEPSQQQLGIGIGNVTDSSLATKGGKGQKDCVKQIQLWSKLGFASPEKEYECPNINCKARYICSTSYEMLATSHAVIVHHKSKWIWEDVIRNRLDGQIWIYMTRESPIHSRPKWSNDRTNIAFNWSMTFRTASEITIPYGRYFEMAPENFQSGNRNWAAEKTRLIAWMASNCVTSSWPRNTFVKNLQKFLQVDRYGQCGNLKCPRNNAEKCDRLLSSHKFYLALENSECEDYITEKFWNNGLSKNIVPIVYGTTRKDYEKVAPPHSFIHVSDFKNMTDLAEYIKYLDQNDTAYNEYFDWKKYGFVEHYNRYQLHSAKDFFCGIAKKLKQVDDPVLKSGKPKLEILDVKNWWKASCHHRKSIWSS
ncbi:glycoprotein 3-alpha-L-fucosyltransferase A-like [Apostichopus japonicus]|uniref:glycoprotein 3-alpha-L-fucosyltransferase A-like n=1 Tax=Stichopus japonicus TaxID=307972 RepID=UPI003AB6A3B9